MSTFHPPQNVALADRGHGSRNLPPCHGPLAHQLVLFVAQLLQVGLGLGIRTGRALRGRWSKNLNYAQRFLAIVKAVMPGIPPEKRRFSLLELVDLAVLGIAQYQCSG